MRGDAREAGFTLVELLFALVAASMLLIGLSYALRGLEAQFRRSASAPPSAQLIAVQPFLAGMLAHATPLDQGATLAGSPASLDITVPPPESFGFIGPLRLLLRVEQAKDGAALTARFEPSRPGQTLPPSAVAGRVLAHGFKAIRFAYLRRAGDPRERLPRLISILFVTADGTTLPLAFAPRLNMGAACVFDPISLACRT